MVATRDDDSTPEDEGLVEAEPPRMFLLPAPPGTCPECAVAHEADQPHDAQSLFYGVKFHMRHGRAPTWADALAHCRPEIRELWEGELREMGAWTEPKGGG